MPITIPHTSADLKECKVTVSSQSDNNDGLPIAFCSSLKVGAAKHVGTCLVPERQTLEHRININTDCKCYSVFKYASASLGVEHVLHTYCPKETKTILTQKDFDRCSCHYKHNSVIYRSKIEESITVMTFPITNNFSQYETYFKDFINSPEKWYRYVERKDNGEEVRSSWQKVVLVGNSYTQLNPLNDSSAQIQYQFELQLTEYAEAVTNWSY